MRDETIILLEVLDARGGAPVRAYHYRRARRERDEVPALLLRAHSDVGMSAGRPRRAFYVWRVTRHGAMPRDTSL